VVLREVGGVERSSIVWRMKLVRARILIEEEGEFEDIVSAINYFSEKYESAVLMLVEVIEDEIPANSNIRFRR